VKISPKLEKKGALKDYRRVENTGLIYFSFFSFFNFPIVFQKAVKVEAQTERLQPDWTVDFRVDVRSMDSPRASLVSFFPNFFFQRFSRAQRIFRLKIHLYEVSI
jgi:hypothetical protein